MKIGTYYRLPDGRKGLYVGITNADNNIFSYQNDEGEYLYGIFNRYEALEEYREPRTWEDEVLVYELEDGTTFLKLASDSTIGRYKIVGREKVVVPEIVGE